jgi:hypothetical protein
MLSLQITDRVRECPELRLPLLKLPHGSERSLLGRMPTWDQRLTFPLDLVSASSAEACPQLLEHAGDARPLALQDGEILGKLRRRRLGFVQLHNVTTKGHIGGRGNDVRLSLANATAQRGYRVLELAGLPFVVPDRSSDRCAAGAVGPHIVWKLGRGR